MLKKTLLLVILFSLVAFGVMQERPAWYWNGNSWVYQFGDATARGRFWLDYNPIADSCNKREWQIPFTDSISVAQWIRWSIEGTKTLWRIRKIGTFAGMGPTLWIHSNEDVVMTFEGFENPQSPKNDTIKKFYAFADTTVNQPDDTLEWIAAEDLNNCKIRFEFPKGCEPVAKKIWEKIVVTQCNRACEYVDPGGATIVLTLEVIKDWIDPETGRYKDNL